MYLPKGLVGLICMASCCFLRYQFLTLEHAVHHVVPSISFRGHTWERGKHFVHAATPYSGRLFIFLGMLLPLFSHILPQLILAFHSFHGSK